MNATHRIHAVIAWAWRALAPDHTGAFGIDPRMPWAERSRTAMVTVNPFSNDLILPVLP